MTARTYLDHAATSPLDPAVRAAMLACLDSGAGNPSSTHAPGRAARARIEAARAEVAHLIGATPESIVFTSGATEANNLAILGAARANRARGRRLVSVRTEHRAVLDALAGLEREGFDVSLLVPDRRGRVDPEEFRSALDAGTTLASVMLVNNETGVVQDIAALARACRATGTLLHVDAAQAAGRVPIDVTALDVDLLSLSAHKIHGPVGIGALYVRRAPRPTLQPLAFGGGQEGGLRPGTLPAPLIVGMGAAFALASAEAPREPERLRALRERLWAGLSPLPGVHRNGDPDRAAPHILNVSIEGVDGEALLLELDALVLASGAACSAESGEPSYVLRALGRDDALAQASLRFSLGRPTTTADIDRAIGAVHAGVARLRTLAPPVTAASPYSEAVLKLFREAPGAGRAGGEGWVTGEAAEPLTATRVRWYLKAGEGRLERVAYRVRGCPHTIAAAARASQVLPGQSLAGLDLDLEGLARELDIPAAKRGRLFVIQDALHKALLQLGAGPP